MAFFDTLPPLPEGTPDSRIFNTGCGLADDTADPQTAYCEMRLVYNVWSEAFEEWLKAAASALVITPVIRDDGSGIYAEFALPEGGIFYAYYIRHSREARFLLDPFSLPSAQYSDDREGRADALLVQYGLYYGKMIPLVTSDCGMCYFVRLPDNRIIMLDGGEIEQCTAPAMEDITALLHRLTGTENGEKITVAAWLCTHAHNDHMDVFSKLLREHRNEIEVERVIFNFPSATVIEFNACVARLKERIEEFAPAAKYMKIHSGQKITVCGVEIEALVTHEDIINLNHRRIYDGMNGTTTVFRITADGKSFIALGDLQEEGAEELTARYSREYLRCVWLQAAHHCINSVNKAYRNIKTDRVLIPQAETDCRTRNLHNYESIRQFNEDESCIFAGNGTDVFSFSRGAQAVEHYPVRGCPYDGSCY